MDGKGDLGRDLLEEFAVVRIGLARMYAADVQGAEAMFLDEQRQIDHPPQALLDVIVIFPKHLFFLEVSSDV